MNTQTIAHRAFAVRRFPPAGIGALANSLSAPLTRLLLPSLLLVAWQAASVAQLLPVQILPAPSAVLTTLLDLLRDGTIAENLRISLVRITIGFAFGGGLGLLAGIALGLSDRLDRLFGPFFRFVAQIPSIGWLPPLFILFGVSETLKYVIIAKACFVPILLNTSEGIRGVPLPLREVARTLRLSRFSLLRRLILPSALPTIFSGIRLAISHAWVALVLVEMLTAAEGIGYMMSWGRTLFQTDVVIAGMIIVGIIGFTIDQGLTRIEHKIRRGESSLSSALHRARPTRRILGLTIADASWQGALVPIGLLLLWFAASHLGLANPHLLVPIETLVALPFTDEAGGHLWAGLAVSLSRMLGGFAIGAGSGLLFGLAMALSPNAERIMGPTFHAIRQITLFAWIPLLTSWFGATDQAKLVFVSLSAFFPMALNAHEGFRNLPRNYAEVATVLRFGTRQRVLALMLPAALPSLLIGLQLALIYGWIGTVGSEYAIGLGRGIGTFMAEGRSQFRMDIVIVGVTTLAAVGMLLNLLLRRVIMRAAPWAERAR